MKYYICVQESERIQNVYNLMLIKPGQKINLNIRSIEQLKNHYHKGDEVISRNPIASAIAEAANVPYTTQY